MIRQAHLKLIARHSVRHGIRGGAGLVSIFMTLVVGLILASIVISPLEEMQKAQDRYGDKFGEEMGALGPEAKAQFSAELNATVIKTARKAIDWAVDPSPEQLDYMTKDKPAMVSAILVLLVLFTPLLVCLGGFNQTSGDIATKGLRFLLIRTERPNIFIGRFLGTYLFTAAVFALLFGILALYMAIKVNVHPPGDMILWLFSGYARIMLFAMPYMAICAWISCAIESPFGSLVISLMLTYMVPLFIRQGEKVNENVGYLQLTNPWGYKWWLLQPAGPQLFGGIAVMLGFTFLFVWLGNRYFGKRDL